MGEKWFTTLSTQTTTNKGGNEIDNEWQINVRMEEEEERGMKNVVIEHDNRVQVSGQHVFGGDVYVAVIVIVVVVVVITLFINSHRWVPHEKKEKDEKEADNSLYGWEKQQ